MYSGVRNFLVVFILSVFLTAPLVIFGPFLQRVVAPYILLRARQVKVYVIDRPEFVVRGAVSESIERAGELAASRADEDRFLIVRGAKGTRSTNGDEVLGVVERFGGEVLKDEGGVLVVRLGERAEEFELQIEALGAEVEVDQVVYALQRSGELVNQLISESVGQRLGGVRVGVVDSGVSSQQLGVLAQVDLVDPSAGSGPVGDEFGHGSAVAALIGDAGADLLVARVLDSQGVGWLSDLYLALEWLELQGAEVVNLSLGFDESSGVLGAKLNQLSASGVVLVAAGGNQGLRGLVYPAAYESVIAVGAADGPDVASFSSTGVELVAEGLVDNMVGSSVAAARVSGKVAELILAGEANPRVSLRKGARDIGDAGVDQFSGFGLVE